MRSLIKTTGLALFAMILSVSARAQNVEVGSGIYCDSQPFGHGCPRAYRRDWAPF